MSTTREVLKVGMSLLFEIFYVPQNFWIIENKNSSRPNSVQIEKKFLPCTPVLFYIIKASFVTKNESLLVYFFDFRTLLLYILLQKFECWAEAGIELDDNLPTALTNCLTKHIAHSSLCSLYSEEIRYEK